ncbi:MAG: BREX-6 system adenine-specific DNA-methyltransferase PglX [Myxococcales bacterium]|nr:BREX-6 system adenine-specific DNA-methyltransferase PglX [Myxococcales bacterium]
MMTPDAKKQLSSTMRALRTALLQDLHDATESAYRLSVRAQDSGLSEAGRGRRKRLETWIAEAARAEIERELASKRKDSWSPDKVVAERRKLDVRLPELLRRFREEAEKQAAYTLLNRLVLLRLLEAAELRQPRVVTGGWESRGYKDFRSLAPALVRGDESEGYAFLLQLVFEDLAVELPGLYGPVGVADLVPIPSATLRRVVEALDDPALETCWTDDMTLGWVYQYWNDPEREALDAKLNGGGKVEPHEIASKTQMFTERYMVDWLLQNSLGPMWLAMCRKHGWTAEVEADGTLDALEARRADWRAKREAGEVELTALMPLHSDAECRWAYFLPQPIPDDAVASAPDTVRDLKLIDPAVGSGHFLVVALELLFALYQEEARHRGEVGEPRWTDAAIVEHILSHNLHGIDLDARAVQIAAAALWLKAKQLAPDASVQRMNLVASALRLSSLPDDDPALLELRQGVEAVGIEPALTDRLVEALAGADHLGSLLQVDKAVRGALAAAEGAMEPDQGGLFTGFGEKRRKVVDRAKAHRGIVERLEAFLAAHTGGDDLGLRLRGEQLAAGVRFVRMVQEDTYDLVVGNPPYQGTSKMAEDAYVKRTYPRGKADLYAAFLERGLQLARPGGTSALLTMRNWMFIKQYAALREWLLETFDLRGLLDLSSGAFEEINAAQVVVSVVVSVFRRAEPTTESVALKAFDDETVTTQGETERKRAAVLAGVGRHAFDAAALKVVPEWPLVYWWSAEFLAEYATTPLLGRDFTIRQGLGTRDNPRFIRAVWEVACSRVYVERAPGSYTNDGAFWSPFVMGGGPRQWFEPLAEVVNYAYGGVEVGNFERSKFGRGRDLYFRRGVAFSAIGSEFRARVHRYSSIISDVGASVFGPDTDAVLCSMNSERSRQIMGDLNPTIHFKIVDVARIPLFAVDGASAIVRTTSTAFEEHERRRESSVEFESPAPSPWLNAQVWAQSAVDRPTGAPLPSYTPECAPEPPTDHISFALGVALGRFGLDANGDGTGILDPATDDLSAALPAGICFLDGTLDLADLRDSLGHPAAAFLHAKWASHGPQIDTKRKSLRDYLRLDFFKDVHRQMYENRPIHWPLSSSAKTYVAWVNIHRWNADTLRVLLADHLHPALTRLDGELDDLRAARE